MPQNLTIEQVFMNFRAQKSEFFRKHAMRHFLFPLLLNFTHFFVRTRQKCLGKIYLPTAPNAQAKIDPGKPSVRPSVKSVQSALSDLLTTSATHGTFSRPNTKRGFILIGLELNTNARESFEHC